MRSQATPRPPKPLTLQQQRNRTPYDISPDVPCFLTGPNEVRPSIVYVPPNKLQHVIDKYADRPQTLRVPQWALNGLVLPDLLNKPGAAAADKTVDRHGRAGRGVVCLNAGKFYESVAAAAKSNGLSQQLVGACLKGLTRTAKGRTFRAATPTEIVEATDNPAWRFAGELVAMTKPKNVKDRY